MTPDLAAAVTRSLDAACAGYEPTATGAAVLEDSFDAGRADVTVGADGELVAIIHTAGLGRDDLSLTGCRIGEGCPTPLGQRRQLEPRSAGIQ